MLKYTHLEQSELVPLVLKALEAGPKTVIAIKIWIEIKKGIWVPDAQIASALHLMIESGSVESRDVGLIVYFLSERSVS